jgi:hypothetical protein
LLNDVGKTASGYFAFKKPELFKASETVSKIAGALLKATSDYGSI